MFAMEDVRCSDVNGIDILFFERGLQILVGVSLYPVAITQFLVFFRVSSDKRG